MVVEMKGGGGKLAFLVTRCNERSFEMGGEPVLGFLTRRLAKGCLEGRWRVVSKMCWVWKGFMVFEENSCLQKNWMSGHYISKQR